MYNDKVPNVFNITAVDWLDSTIMACKHSCLGEDTCLGFVYLVSEQRCNTLHNDTTTTDDLTPVSGLLNLSSIIITAGGYDTWIRTTCLGKPWVNVGM